MNDEVTIDPRFEGALRQTLQELAPASVPAGLETLGWRARPAAETSRWGGRTARRGQVLLRGVALIAIVSVLATVAIWSSLTREATSPGFPASPFISGFVDQTDGLYGYRMLRPVNWTPTSSPTPDGRRYDAPGTSFLTEGLSFVVVNLAAVPAAQRDNSTWRPWLANPTLAGWTTAAEQNDFGAGNATVTPLRTLPNARIFAVTYPGLTYMVLVGLVVDDGHPIFLQLAGAGTENSLDRLVSQHVVDDFATMVASVRAIGADPANVSPPLPSGEPQPDVRSTPDA